MKRRIAAGILPALLHTYADTADANYDQAREAYDDVARQLTKALGAADPDAAPEAIMRQPKTVSNAWASVPVLVKKLEQAADQLGQVANLAGIENTDHATVQLALTVDARGAHRRRVWDAWQSTTGRAGRWGALVEVGAKLAAPALARVRPYRMPKPVEYRQVAVPGALIAYRLEPIDPEDNARD